MGNAKVKNTRHYGTCGENSAAKHLEENGYTVLCRNYCVKGGEIDIVATKGDKICFVEVKARRLSSGERPIEAVDKTKRENLSFSAEKFLEEYRDNAYVSALTPQLCVVEIYMDSKSNAVKYGLSFDTLY